MGRGGAVGASGFGIQQFRPYTEGQKEWKPVGFETQCQHAFRGMRDSEDPQTADPTFAKLIQNAYPLNSATGARVVGRPGFVQAGAQLGASETRRVQGIGQYTKLDGTEYTVCVVGGKFYKYTWGTTTWTEVTLENATVSTTAPVYFVTMADVLVVSDGVNKPWTWNGTTDTELTNAPVLYGQPTVYYAKLFGIKNIERSTIVWSEEADPTEGYEAGGYNNAWTLGQTDQDRLTAVLGTNEALFYWRPRSLGAIRGMVDVDFVNSGTREGVSATVGTASPGGVVVGGDDVYFMDADNRVHSLSLSGGRLDTNVWKSLRETRAGWDATKADKSLAVYDPQTNLALVGAVASGGTECNRYVAVDIASGEIAGIWQGWTSTALGVVKNASGQPVVMHGTANGYVYVHGLPDGSVWNDQSSTADGGTAAIAHVVTGAFLGAHMYQAKKFVRWDVNLYLETAATLAFSYKTSRGTPTAQNKSVTASVYPREHHASVGLLGDGRWILPTITHQSGSERFGLNRWCVTSVLYGAEPEIP